MSASGELTPQLRREAKLPRYRGRPHPAATRIQALSSMFHLLHLLHSDLTCQIFVKLTFHHDCKSTNNHFIYIYHSLDLIKSSVGTRNR